SLTNDECRFILISASGVETNTCPAGVRNRRPLSRKITEGCLVAVLLTAMAYPFLNDAYHRHATTARLAGAMNEYDRAALAAWDGDAVSFARHLHARCELTFGKDARTCDRYRFVAER